MKVWNVTLRVTLERDYVHNYICTGRTRSKGRAGHQWCRWSTGEYLVPVSHWRTNCEPTCLLSVSRVTKERRDRVELLDPRADRDLLEGVAHLGSWDREDPRYVKSRQVQLGGNWIVFFECVQGAIGPNGEQGARGRNGDAVSAVIDRVKFDVLF